MNTTFIRQVQLIQLNALCALLTFASKSCLSLGTVPCQSVLFSTGAWTKRRVLSFVHKGAPWIHNYKITLVASWIPVSSSLSTWVYAWVPEQLPLVHYQGSGGQYPGGIVYVGVVQLLTLVIPTLIVFCMVCFILMFTIWFALNVYRLSEEQMLICSCRQTILTYLDRLHTYEVWSHILLCFHFILPFFANTTLCVSLVYPEIVLEFSPYWIN